MSDFLNRILQKNCYRTHCCGDLTENLVGKTVKVAGWIETIRDHGGIVFIDLRDHFGNVQIVVDDLNLTESLTKESVVAVQGVVLKRSDENINSKLATGFIEIKAQEINVLSKCIESLPFEIQSSHETREELRLKYRFLDLRNSKLHKNIVLRSRVLSFLRKKMDELDFVEIQTPVLSASSPEGARDYLIPSRKHKGRFYALPQAPQMFKQLLMVSGFDKYYQIAPCFRDEDSRADRSPGEFYQLDFEMAFATQEEVFAVAEEILYATFTKFSENPVSKPPFRRISYKDSMLKYGTDKPDLRNPLEIIDLTDFFADIDFAPFKNKTVRTLVVPNCADKGRKFFDEMQSFATEIGMKGLGYIKVLENQEFSGPIAKFIPENKRENLLEITKIKPNGVLFFIADDEKTACKFAGQIRTKLGEKLCIINKNRFEMCFIIDFPMFETDEDTGKIIFTHNPFSMPQGGISSLINKNPLEILAFQYDIVCNGVELSSGAVRNHVPEIMRKAFEIAGYSEDNILEKFAALYNSFKFGAPPHAGMAPGIDRIIMLLTGEESIREIIAFPMNSSAQDVLLGAPNEVSEKQLKEVHIKVSG